MKSQKGITLTSLTIYILLVLVIVGIIATITASFRDNINDMNSEGVNHSEIDKFSVYFLREVKRQENSVITVSDTEIVFNTGNKYTFKENSIYLNDNIQIAENIENCAFMKRIENNKEIIQVKIKPINSEEREIEYVINSENISSTYNQEND